MTVSPELEPSLAVVVRSGEESCVVVADGAAAEVAFASFFPAPRVERVLPGHLVLVLQQQILWRWFDAVVVDGSTGRVRLWEPAHGEVLAQARDSKVTYLPGRRAYLSAGLPGAEWWVEGEALGSSADRLVDTRAVIHFLRGHGLLETPPA